jgi:hypothetical protein
MHTLSRYIATAMLIALSGLAAGQSTPEGATAAGKQFGQSELDRVGTSNISGQKAQENVPFYKPNPVQKNDSRTDGNLFYDMGIGQVNSSKAYQPGQCDREGFDPATEGKKGVGAAKWARMSQAERDEAIANQKKFFDQECEGINFLAGEYPGRTQYEVRPGDDLEGWNPDQFPPNQNGECETRTITTPDEFQINTCHETQNIAKKQCYREANVTTYTEDVLSDKTSVHVIVNHNSPAWTLTINPKAGTVEVSGNDVYVGQTCGYECIDSGGDGGSTWCGEVCRNSYGFGSETITLYGGQTSIWQTYKTSEVFIVRAYPIDACVFRIENYHLKGGAGAPDVHMYWEENLCEPVTRFNVDWKDNCGPLDAATMR